MVHFRILRKEFTQHRANANPYFRGLWFVFEETPTSTWPLMVLTLQKDYFQFDRGESLVRAKRSSNEIHSQSPKRGGALGKDSRRSPAWPHARAGKLEIRGEGGHDPPSHWRRAEELARADT